MKITKKIYIILGISLFIINSISAQIKPFKSKIDQRRIYHDEYIGIIKAHDGLDKKLIDPCDCKETIPNFSFNFVSSFNIALSNEILLKRARDQARRDWFEKQTVLIKQNIESKLGKSFSDYNKAKDALFLFSEKNNIITNSNPLIKKYNGQMNFYVRTAKLKELKLLQIRRAELNAGNFNNPEYGYLKVSGIALKDIKSLNLISQIRNSLHGVIKSNIREGIYPNSVYQVLKNIYTNESFTNLIKIELN